MAFKKLRVEMHKPQMHSLIDLAFILLLFFLVTSMVAQLMEKEHKFSIPTPKNEPGRAQILIQFISENDLLYLDQNASPVVDDIIQSYSFRSADFQRNLIMQTLMEQGRCNRAQVAARLTELKESAQDHPERKYFILVRCPDELPYHFAIEMIENITGLPNIYYGCVGGSIRDIENARRIRIVEEERKGGIQKNLVIEF
ncbi:MAG: hypothetical protein EHM72_19265 [Calditrichaeota bacterium]|nr:MAG: hypothetical protein EHM72_19265 [Calditrichota bacterium]